MEKRTELESLGEFGLIKHLTRDIALKNESSILGIGDDAAVISTQAGKCTVISTDLLVEGVHFDLAYFPLKHVGYKAVVVNLSDIYAMNAIPEQITVSIAISNRFSVEALDQIYEGINEACETYGVDLIGGDTSSSKAGLVISITAIGSADKNFLAKRSGANENDLLVVSGNLGGAYMGLQVLEREKQIYLDNPKIQPDLSGYDYILERQLKPEARKEVIERFKALDIIPTSMIDISDGLASEIIHLCDQSNQGCTVYEEKLPIDAATAMAAEDFNLNATTCALSGGEDYELLFTISQKDYEKIKEEKFFSVIGHISDKNAGINLITTGGSVAPLTAQGWDAFFKNQDETD